MKLSIKKFAAGVGVPISYDLSFLQSLYTDKGFSSPATYTETIVFSNTTTATVKGGQYATPPPGTDLYVKCTYVSGLATNVGNSQGSWHLLDSVTSVTFGLTYTTSDTEQPDIVIAQFNLDLATDALGTNIVATKSNVRIEVGFFGP